MADADAAPRTTRRDLAGKPGLFPEEGLKAVMFSPMTVLTAEVQHCIRTVVCTIDARFKMTPAQCRAARALVLLSQDALAAASGIAKRTIASFEGGTAQPYARTIASIRAALEAAGVVFIEENGDGPGVRLKKD